MERSSPPQLLYDKLWDSHVVHTEDDGATLLYIDRHLINEVTSPQAFESLAQQGRELWRSEPNIGLVDHVVPTAGRDDEWNDSLAKLQADTLKRNCAATGISFIPLQDVRQGILHVTAPEQGAILPGTTVVCGDSHTSTHGAFATIAFGIGTSDVEHVLATQTLLTKKAKCLGVEFEGSLAAGCSAKDLALAFIREVGSAGATGFAVEYRGNAVRLLSMEGRMTLCNMTIEAGATAGFVAVDDVTLTYLKGRPLAPVGEMWDAAESYWRSLVSDEGAPFDRIVRINAAKLSPQVTWGTTPDMSGSVNDVIPAIGSFASQPRRDAVARALDYMGLKAGQKITDIRPDVVFIGSCTNARIEDLRDAADIVRKFGGRISKRLRVAMVVPGSGVVKMQAEAEGLHEVFQDAGFQWRDPGCSMCLAMNDDRLAFGERCASTSNRNFEGRQGAGGRSHLMSPKMAAAAAMAGSIIDIRTGL
ncbi:3-isopropylmalate dehydratase large subunit [Cupriavidus sp. 2SB]|uniref:3-isopropylmalate dehydratase large subunit n=1 Tax=Cupriavidus sp. 2SB TaxID=2502199 RepID=UPI0010F455D3|nr:3-isopropylmalate dehydratase large subunit [Cupriavidus sp. 2SB]